MADARRNARNEKRKKQRLMKKASSLTAEDLERIAVLKRCGLWNPAETAVPGEAATSDGDEAGADEPDGAAVPAAAAASSASASDAGMGATPSASEEADAAEEEE